MHYAGFSAEEVAARLKTDIILGLDTAEAGARLRKRREIDGGTHWQTIFAVLWRQVANPLVYLLFAAAIIANLIGHTTDALVITVILAINVIIGFLQEYKADRALKMLKTAAGGKARVIREREILEVPANRVVMGDIVLLSPGDRAPADLRMVHCTELAVDESQLTGEALPARKGAHRVDLPGSAERVQPNIVYWGSSVMEGHGRGIAIAVGRQVRFAQVLKKAEAEDEGASPLEEETRRLSHIILGVSLVFLGVVYLFSLVRGYTWQASVALVVNLFVAVIPEGLPMIATLILVTAAVRMARQKSLVRRLAAAEMLGNIDLILTDKTGTLTMGKMVIRDVWLDGRHFRLPRNLTNPNFKKIGLTTGQLTDLVLAGALAGHARIVHGLRGSRGSGDAIDVAFHLLSSELGLDKKFKSWRRVDEVPFASRRRLSAALARDRRQSYVFVKGAPEELIKRSDKIERHGKEVALTQARLDGYNSICHQLASRGKRVLAIARRRVPMGLERVKESELRDLTIIGLIGIDDAPRDDTRSTVESLRQAGILIKMVTGDMPSTAFAIAREVGIADHDSRVLTGEKLADYLRPPAGGRAGNPLKSFDVFARMTPEAKLQLVQFYQSLGYRTAVTGDGVNDAAALKVADIGIALSGQGTDVAKETADLVLVDNNFATLVSALKEGRLVWSSFRKVIFFLVATNLAELLVILIMLILDYPVPFSPTQILWINLIIDTLACQALAFEGSRHSLTERHSRALIPGWLAWRIVITALWQTAVVGGVYLWSLDKFSQNQASTLAFVTLALVQIFNLFNARSLTQSAFRAPLRNGWLNLSAALALALTVLSVYWLPLGNFLGLESLSASQFFSLVLVSLSVVGLVEIDKLWYIRNNKRDGGQYG